MTKMKIKYTAKEVQLIKVLKKHQGERISIEDLCNEFFETIPNYGRSQVNAILRNLIYKTNIDTGRNVLQRVSNLGRGNKSVFKINKSIGNVKV